jgi:hypothetical protein
MIHIPVNRPRSWDMVLQRKSAVHIRIRPLSIVVKGE